MPKNVENEATFGGLPGFHHLSDGRVRLADEVAFGNSEYIEEDVIDLSLALKFVAKSRLLLLLGKLSESTDMFRPNFVGNDCESLQSSLILRSELEATIEDSRSAIDVVRS
jgi:hypothetical protein